MFCYRSITPYHTWEASQWQSAVELLQDLFGTPRRWWSIEHVWTGPRMFDVLHQSCTWIYVKVRIIFTQWMNIEYWWICKYDISIHTAYNYVTPVVPRCLKQCRCVGHEFHGGFWCCVQGTMSTTQLRWFAALLWPPWKCRIFCKTGETWTRKIQEDTKQNYMKCWELMTAYFKMSNKRLGKDKGRTRATLPIPRRWALVPVGNNGCGFLEVRFVISWEPARWESPTTLWLTHIWFLQGH